jgi:phosphatidyl-myo-inositol dimannoside synthase
VLPVLFATRRFPPSVGGMETLAAAVATVLAENRPFRLIALRRVSLMHLVWFGPLCAVRIAIATIGGRVSRVIFGDALLFALCRPFIWKSKLPVVVMVHGLDLKSPSPLYQNFLRWAIARADRVVANSKSTKSIALSLGVPAERLEVLLPAVATEEQTGQDRDSARKRVIERFGLPQDTFILLSVGRLIPRKGISWFISEVLPDLPPKARLLVAGTGPEEDRIRGTIQRFDKTGRVKLLGRVSNAERNELLLGSDLFIMPNVATPGDVEGFGIAAVEASIRGTPALAADLEGIKDAVIHGQTGIRVSSEDAEAFKTQIARLIQNRDALTRLSKSAAAVSRELFSLERLAKEVPAKLL